MRRHRRRELRVQKRVVTLALDLGDQRISRSKGSLRKETSSRSFGWSAAGQGGRWRWDRRRLGAGGQTKEAFDLAARIQRRVNVHISLAGSDHVQNVGHGEIANRRKNPDETPVGLRRRRVDIKQNAGVRCVNVHPGDRTCQIRISVIDDGGLAVGGETKRCRARTLRSGGALRPQLGDIKRGTVGAQLDDP